MLWNNNFYKSSKKLKIMNRNNGVAEEQEEIKDFVILYNKDISKELRKFLLPNDKCMSEIRIDFPTYDPYDYQINPKAYLSFFKKGVFRKRFRGRNYAILEFEFPSVSKKEGSFDLKAYFYDPLFFNMCGNVVTQLNERFKKDERLNDYIINECF